MRLDDLHDTHQEHSWLFAINPELDVVLPESDWITAMRIRLGCRILSGAHAPRTAFLPSQWHRGDRGVEFPMAIGTYFLTNFVFS